MFKKKKFFLISLLFILNSTLTNATTVGAWVLSNPTAVGASILYDGSKGSVTSSILITPNASQVTKVLRGGIAGYALTLAVEQLLGVVDWVFDPANNQIKYKEIQIALLYAPTHERNTKFDTASKACSYYASLIASYGYLDTSVVSYTEGINATCTVKRKSGSGYTSSTYPLIVTNAITSEKIIPLETIAQKVIENAQNNNLDAQFAVLAAATNILLEAEQDDAKAEPIERKLEENADDKCRIHNAYMNGQARIIEDRYNEMFVDSYDLYNKYYAIKNPLQGVGSWEGHVYRYVQVEQPILRQRILDAVLAGCYETPSASRWKQKAPPPRPGAHSPG